MSKAEGLQVETTKARLDDIINGIKRSYENFKKCPKVRRTSAYAKVRIEHLTENWAQFCECYKNLPLLEQRAHTQEYGEVEELFLTYKTDMMEVIEASIVHNNTSTSVDGIQCRTGGVSLPRISLPKFAGGHEDWQGFEDTFVSLIESNQNLSDVQRLHYLKSCLTGEAAAAIKSYQVTESNYKPAWECLKKRYCNKKLIINAIMKKMFGARRISSQSASQLKNLIDTIRECLTGINNCGIQTTDWDPIVIYMVSQKLDIQTHKEWEDYVSNNGSELPSLRNLFDFIERRIQTLELTTTPTNKLVLHASAAAAQLDKPRIKDNIKICEYCDEKHSLPNCNLFGKLAQPERSDFVKGKNLCFYCLLPGHSVRFCRLKGSCKICLRRHHPLLCSSKLSARREASEPKAKVQNTEVSLHTHINTELLNEVSEPSEVSMQAPVATLFTCMDSPGLLATALVPVRDGSGNMTILRAIVDPGAQVTLISERAAQRLRSEKTPIQGHVSGTGSAKSAVTHVTSFEIVPESDPTFNLKVICYVTAGNITTFFPKKSLDSRSWHHVKGLKLADPSFDRPGKIDLLLSSKVYAKILRSGVIHGEPDQPTAQNTRLGWIIFGETGEDSHKEALSLHIHTDLDNMLKGMWELEPTERRRLTADEKLCEKIYEKTHTRDSEGRYVVKLPFKTLTPISVQGETRDIALRRLQQLEKKFQQKPELKSEYTKVMKEYLDMNHMEPVPEDEKKNPAVYLPHHAVVREDKDTSKTRVVFDASNKGTNNVSLNEELLVGPQLQDDLRNLIMKWRMKKICFIADIQRMYREILVTKEDTDYQRILWRDNDEQEVQDFRLLRVTFGTASAPYLAVRTLHQLAEDEGKHHPTAARTIKEEFFMDDMMSGQDTIEAALEVAQAVKDILKKGGFTLHKWASNNLNFLQHFQPDECSTHVTHVNLDLQGMVKALGIAWDVGQDVFQYQLTLPSIPKIITKRVILSELQRLFDPLGWLAPAILPARIVMQKLWLKGINWDVEVDDQLREEWLKIRQGLENLKEIEIPRWLGTTTERLKNTTIHGFSDASTKAYAAVAYMRVETEDGDIKTGIIAAKGRVAPTKTVSLPRLELLGALVLSRLLKQIREATGLSSNNKIYAWTDSTVVLSWLNGDPGRWNVFVSNRVVEILENMGTSQFYHVVSEENPADVASRGSSPSALAQNHQWWSGPSWLQTNNIPFSRGKIEDTNLEMRKCFHTTVDINEEKKIDLKEFDTLIELQRVLAYARRFLNYKKTKIEDPKGITTKELEESLEIMIKRVQTEEFEEEILRLQRGKPVKKTSKLKTLNPFLDSKNILRVGGRLRNADLPEKEKHPIILGHNNDLLPLLINDAHRRTLHGGVQLTLTYLRSQYWILKIKSSVRQYLHKCLVCAKQRAKAREQIMGDLPEARVTPARPFKKAAVDFAGPFEILMSRFRGAKTCKAYLAVFVCMVTRCIHLELVGSLTCEGFVNAFKRFVARRGRCAHMWSDNGTNLAAGNTELAKLWKEAQLDLPEKLQHLLAEDGTQWHHIPPYSPTLGGLWESGVASVKYHLKRILNTNLTFEEFSTVLCQIEACLNSRPLCPTDCDDPDIVEVLTPGHFLIGESLMNVPSPDLNDVPVSRLSRWQHCQRVVQHFWRRWQQEYLTRLQNRPKWHRQRPEFNIGDIVLVKEDNIPPGKWSMGRIVQKHTGNDGVCRVYSLKYHGKITQRSVSRLCPLPIND